jgi:O-antigen ligase
MALRRAGWLSACALLLVLFQSFFHQPVAPLLAAAVLLLTGLTLWHPFAGLLTFAGIGPLASILMALGRGEAGTIVFVEVLMFAFLTGWTVRQVLITEPLRIAPTVRAPAILIGLAAFASAIVQAARVVGERPEEPVDQLVRQYIGDYVRHLRGGEPITAAVLVAGGMLLILAAAHLTAEAPERKTAVLRMLVCGAGAAALLNLLRLVTVSMQREYPVAAFLELLATIRVNVHYADRNAAGSYFAMTLLLAVALANRARGLFAVTAPLIAAALWVSGSRVALAAAGLAGIGGLLVFSYHSSMRTIRPGALAGLAGVIIVAGAIWTWYPEGRNTPPAQALEIRLELAGAGIQMAAEHPVFGVGLGRYYALSNRYAGEALEAAGFVRENAHNNFIQILAELGVPGLIGFIVLLGASFAQLLRWPASSERRWLAAGLAAYLLTCLGGHPLLVAEAAVPFWLTLGLAAAPAALPPPVTSRWRYTTTVLAVLLMVSIWPRAASSTRNADLEHVSLGLSRWQHEPDGRRFRWAGGRSTFYVASTARAMRIPLWHGWTDRRPIQVAIFMNEREVDRIMLQADDRWRVVRLVLPDQRNRDNKAFRRFDLIASLAGEAEPLPVVADDSSGAIKVGRLEIEP